MICAECLGPKQLMPLGVTGLRSMRPQTAIPQPFTPKGISHFHTIGESRRGFLRDSGSRVAFSLEAAGIRRLSNSRMAIRSSRAETTIGDGQHRQRQEEVRSGLIPLVSPGTRNSAGSNYQLCVFNPHIGEKKFGAGAEGIIDFL